MLSNPSQTTSREKGDVDRLDRSIYGASRWYRGECSDVLLSEVLNQQEEEMAAIQDVADKVSAQTTVIDGVTTLLDGLKTQLTDVKAQLAASGGDTRGSMRSSLASRRTPTSWRLLSRATLQAD